jgi:hypothetical protein
MRRKHEAKPESAKKSGTTFTMIVELTQQLQFYIAQSSAVPTNVAHFGKDIFWASVAGRKPRN